MDGTGHSTSWPEWLGPETRYDLERGPLPRFLAQQRWFAGRARGLAGARFVDVSAPITGSVLTVIDVSHDDGTVGPYFLPLRPAPSDESDRWTIAPGLIDALTHAATTSLLLQLIGDGAALPTARGTIQGVATSAFGAARGDGADLSPSYGWIEQSHSAVRFGERLFLKVFRRLAPGVDPDFEVGRFLTERARFDRVPLTAGALVYQRPREAATTLCLLQAWVPSLGTGWDRARVALINAYRAADPTRALAPEVAAATTLGRRTAELHQALASDPTDPAFAPEPITERDVREVADEAQAQVQTTLAALAARRSDLPANAVADARFVLDHAPSLEAGLVDFARTAPSGRKQRVHGDLHLGQVLRTDQDDFVFIDFEGEPIKPLERRRARQCPLKDVVGVLRSFDYAAFGALFALAESGAEATGPTLAAALSYRERASAAFWSAYRQGVPASGFLPEDGPALDAWLAVLTLDKTLYELLYELNHRPDWVRIPLQGVRALIERATAPSGGTHS